MERRSHRLSYSFGLCSPTFLGESTYIRFWGFGTFLRTDFSVFAQFFIGFSVLKLTRGFGYRYNIIGGFSGRDPFSIGFWFFSYFRLEFFFNHQMIQIIILNKSFSIKLLVGYEISLSDENYFFLSCEPNFKCGFLIFIDFRVVFRFDPRPPPTFERFCGSENPTGTTRPVDNLINKECICLYIVSPKFQVQIFDICRFFQAVFR